MRIVFNVSNGMYTVHHYEIHGLYNELTFF